MPRKKKELPYYASQKQAAAALQIEVALVRQACTEDSHMTRAAGRVDKARLAAWLEDYQWRKTNPPVDPDGAAGNDAMGLTEIKRMRELVALKRESLKLDTERDSLLPAADFEKTLAAMVGAFVTTINQVPGRAAQKIIARARVAVIDMLRGSLTAAQFAKIEAILDTAAIEYGEIQAIINLELEHARQVLARCDFLEEPAPVSAPAGPANQAPESPQPRRRGKSGNSRGKARGRKEQESSTGTADTAGS